MTTPIYSVEEIDKTISDVMSMWCGPREAKIYIYRNLNRGTDFSAKLRGKVMFRGDIVASNVQFKVSTAGRARVLKDKKRNVHAFAVAETIVEFTPVAQGKLKQCNLLEVKYNPYKGDTFMCEGEPIHEAHTVYFYNGRCYIHHDTLK